MKIGLCQRCGFQNFVTETACRTCGASLDDLPDKSPSFFGRVRDAITKRGLKKHQMQELKGILRSALADGTISDNELDRIGGFYKESELSRKEFAAIRDEIYLEFVDLLLRDHRLSPEEKQSILAIAERIGFSRSSLGELKKTFRYFELLHTIETSALENLPVAGSSRVILKEGEVDYFTAVGSLLEERVVKSEVVGRSHGISIPIMKGIRYRVGQSRGKMVSERGIVPISSGDFTITNRRLVFSGDKKSVNAEFSKLQDIEFFSDGLRFSVTNRQLPVTVQFEDARCAEVCRLYISRILN